MDGDKEKSIIEKLSDTMTEVVGAVKEKLTPADESKSAAIDGGVPIHQEDEAAPQPVTAVVAPARRKKAAKNKPGGASTPKRARKAAKNGTKRSAKKSKKAAGKKAAKTSSKVKANAKRGPAKSAKKMSRKKAKRPRR
jgi:hypothetical protein